MAAATNISLADALGSPVTHIFVPLGPQGKFDMIWEDQSQVSPNGFWRIGVRHKRPTNQQKVAGANHYIEITLMEPVLEAIAPAASGLTQPPTVAYVPMTVTTHTISDRSTLQVRKDLRKMNANLQAEAQLIAWVENFVPAY